MFDWLFPPSCPCDPAAKDWVESRLQWLADEFPNNAFTGRQIVLPTPEFFPDPYDASPAAVRTLFDQVCGYMDVVPNLVELRLFKNSAELGLINDAGHAISTGFAGTYQDGIIKIEKSGLHDPMSLVGTIAHELAHHRLLGESRISHEVFDNELLTDLTVIHFGLGIFLANSPRDWHSQYTTWPDTDLVRPEYLSPPMFGWALAHLAWFRNEPKPPWSKHLRGPTRANFKQSLRYLLAKNDSWYRPPRLRRRK